MEKIVWFLGGFTIVVGLIMAIFPESAVGKKKRNDPNQVMTTRIVGIVLIIMNIGFIMKNL